MPIEAIPQPLVLDGLAVQVHARSIKRLADFTGFPYLLNWIVRTTIRAL